jgi:hypothetical protein
MNGWLIWMDGWMDGWIDKRCIDESNFMRVLRGSINRLE